MKTKWYCKTPDRPFERRAGYYFRSPEKAIKDIEESANRWRCGDPWLQLVREDDKGWEVVAEYQNHGCGGWVTPLQAIGLADLP